MSRCHQLMFEAGIHAAALLVPRPAPAPAIGDTLEGGYYMGAAWDTVVPSATITLDMATVAVADKIVVPLPDEGPLYGYYTVERWPFYPGQLVRLAPISNRTQVFIDATVLARTNSGLRVLVTSKIGSTGSFSAWVIAARWKVILAPKTGGKSTINLAYKTATTAAPAACITLTNGRAATAAMIAANTAAGSVIYPAADFVRGVNTAALSGYADWELPARDWLELMWRNLKPVTLDNNVATRPKTNIYIRDANTDDIANEGRGLNRHSIPAGAAYTTTNPAQTSLAPFQSGGAEAPPWEISFWSSSEYSSTIAWLQAYSTSTPGRQGVANKSSSYRVRAVRRSIM